MRSRIEVFTGQKYWIQNGSKVNLPEPDVHKYIFKNQKPNPWGNGDLNRPEDNLTQNKMQSTQTEREHQQQQQHSITLTN